MALDEGDHQRLLWESLRVFLRLKRIDPDKVGLTSCGIRHLTGISSDPEKRQGRAVVEIKITLMEDE